MGNVNLTAEIFYLPLFMVTLTSRLLFIYTYSILFPIIRSTALWRTLNPIMTLQCEPAGDRPSLPLELHTRVRQMVGSLHSWRDGDQQGQGRRQLQTKWVSSWPAVWGMGETLFLQESLRCWKDSLVTQWMLEWICVRNEECGDSSNLAAWLVLGLTRRRRKKRSW